jgi:hypothetical protein
VEQNCFLQIPQTIDQHVPYGILIDEKQELQVISLQVVYACDRYQSSVSDIWFSFDLLSNIILQYILFFTEGFFAWHSTKSFFAECPK